MCGCIPAQQPSSLRVKRRCQAFFLNKSDDITSHCKFPTWRPAGCRRGRSGRRRGAPRPQTSTARLSTNTRCSLSWDGPLASDRRDTSAVRSSEVRLLHPHPPSCTSSTSSSIAHPFVLFLYFFHPRVKIKFLVAQIKAEVAALLRQRLCHFIHRTDRGGCVIWLRLHHQHHLTPFSRAAYVKRRRGVFGEMLHLDVSMWNDSRAQRQNDPVPLSCWPLMWSYKTCKQ